jgi:hypothetical protein
MSNENIVNSLINNLFIKENVIDNNLCEEIIKLFEDSNKKYKGVILGGVNNNVKNTVDLHMSHEPELFFDIDKKINSILNVSIYEYIDKLNSNCPTINMLEFTDSGFNIQKYFKNEGFYIYHNDSSIDYEKYKYRLFTYLLYLNNVDEGGETEFFGNYKIKPKSGRLLLFPACWTYPHKSLMPISNDKYIITGWVYFSEKKNVCLHP